MAAGAWAESELIFENWDFAHWNWNVLKAAAAGASSTCNGKALGWLGSGREHVAPGLLPWELELVGRVGDFENRSKEAALLPRQPIFSAGGRPTLTWFWPGGRRFGLAALGAGAGGKTGDFGSGSAEAAQLYQQPIFSAGGRPTLTWFWPGALPDRSKITLHSPRITTVSINGVIHTI